MRLRDTDLTAHHRIAEPVTAGDQIGGTDPIPTLGVGPAAQRPTPAIDIAVAITAVHTTFVDRTDHRRQRTLGASSQPFEPFEQLGELPPVEPFQALVRDRPTRRSRASSHSSEPSDHNGPSIGGSRHAATLNRGCHIAPDQGERGLDRSPTQRLARATKRSLDTVLAPIARTSVTTALSLVTTTTWRVAGRRATSERMTSSAITPSGE